jgi:hypothetical protein
LLFVGDVMLGRGVSPLATADPVGLFEEVRLTVRDADLALANLESPLTTRPHLSPNPNALEADPRLATLLADAGFDIVGLANNHIGDAGPEGVLDTVVALTDVGMAAVGAGEDISAATRPIVIDRDGLNVAIVAFDASGGGLEAGQAAGVATWSPDGARRAVAAASATADLVVVSIHGGVEYLPERDPRMDAIASDLTEWGADVVWGHGAHVVQPVTVAGETRAVATTSLGNFLFDQRGPLTGSGAILEVLADESGVLAYRIGHTDHRDLRVHFDGWDLPTNEAALIEGEWWDLTFGPLVESAISPDLDGFPWGEIVDASRGSITGVYRDEIVVSFRHVPGPHPVREGLPDVDWLDEDGMSHHLGIYQAEDLTPIWVAGMVPAPVARVAACDGSVAMAYSTLDEPEVVATGAAIWRPGGLHAVSSLPGAGTPTCADVDGDGLTEPVIADRS